MSTPLHAAGFDPDTYEAEIRKEAHIPDEWLACGSDRDCVIATLPCQTGIAVARRHRADTEGAICRAEDCSHLCTATAIARSYTACEDEICVLRLGDRPPRKVDEADDEKTVAKKATDKKSSTYDGDKIDPRDIP